MMQNSCIKLAVVKNRCTYDASISRNLGVLLCSTDLIFNMDCDVYIENKYLFQMVLALPRDNTVYRGGQYRVTGSCIMTNRIWWLVGGLSEDYRGSAHIDLDLYTRMAAAGVQYRLLNTGICRHWDHLLIQRDAWIPVKRQDMEQTTIHSRWNRSRLFSRQDVSLLLIEKNE
jgi:predicted glycosyltransferase involved in capsule biosynthesis